MKNLFFILLVGSSLLSACGGGGSGGSKNSGEATAENILNAISPKTASIASLPAEPDSVAAKSSISGIDTNGNRVRDDIEIVLTKALLQDGGEASSADFNKMLDIVKLIHPSETAKTIDMKQFYCGYQSLPASIKSKVSSSTLINIVTDTPARKKAFYEQSVNTSGSLGAEICE